MNTMALTKAPAPSLVDKIKKESLSNFDSNTLLSPSPYDTAWLAIVPDPHDPNRPMFEQCLDWVVNNQREEGFWGDSYEDDEESVGIDCLPATLACLIALKSWRVGSEMIDRGIQFIHGNAEKLLKRKKHNSFPRGFTIVFTGMLELAWSCGLQVSFPESVQETIVDIFSAKQSILKREEVVDKHRNFPLLSFLEALPPSYQVDQDLEESLSSDGSLFQSPSATACAYMATGSTRCLSYLESLVKSCPNGVPSLYPVDEELKKLVMVNQLVRLGLTEHFVPEIQQLLSEVQRSYKTKTKCPKSTHMVETGLYKDILAFCLLRINGYNVSPSIFCWFLHDEEILDHIKNNYRDLGTVLLNVYRAADLMFSGEHELQQAGSFSKNYLEKIVSEGNFNENLDLSPSLLRMIKHELELPWTARLDHLEHRMWMEEKDANALWMGKFCYNRLSHLHNDDLLDLASQNYTFRQTVYLKELEEAKRWSKERGLCDMGFGREKTTYCYFACAASSSLPCTSDIRLIVTKSAIVITVADDFFDMEGSLEDLEKLTGAVLSWDAEGLSGHSKTIFEALDDLVSDVRVKCFRENGNDIKDSLRHLWYETFHSWFMEAKWGRERSKPSTEEYLTNAMTSIAAHTVVIPASCFLGHGFIPSRQIWSAPYQDITTLLMATTRLLNDIQSYSKEETEGKINYVWLHMNENPDSKIEDSIQHTKAKLTKMMQQFLEHALTEEHSDDLPKSYKQLHLSCFKVFHMFFHSSNRYDSDTDLLHDIQKAFVSPPVIRKLKPLQPPSLLPLVPPTQRRRPEILAETRVSVSSKSVSADRSPVKSHPLKVLTMPHSFGLGRMNRMGYKMIAAPKNNLSFR